LAVLTITLGIFSLLAGLAGVVLGVFVVVDYSGLAATILLILGAIVFLFGILEIVYGFAFLGGKGWSWTLGMIIAVVSLVSSIGVIGVTAIAGPRLAAITSDVYEIVLPELIIISMIAIVPITTSSVTIYGLTRRNVKVFFGKGPEPEA